MKSLVVLRNNLEREEGGSSSLVRRLRKEEEEERWELGSPDNISGTVLIDGICVSTI